MSDDLIALKIKQMEYRLHNIDMNDFEKWVLIERLLNEYNEDKSKYGLKIKELQKELSNIDVTSSGVVVTHSEDVTHIYNEILLEIEEMWGKYNKVSLYNILTTLFAHPHWTVKSIKSMEEQVLNPSNIAVIDVMEHSSKSAIRSPNIIKKIVDKDKLIFKVLERFQFYQSYAIWRSKLIIEDIQKHTDPFKTEKHIKMFARILVRKGIIDADRMQTFYIIFSFGFSQNYIVTSYMIPAQVEYLFLKILKENGKDINRYETLGTIREYIQLQEILNDDKHSQNIKKYIDNDIFDEFKYLFKHDNMRNNIYHGQRGDELKDSGYLWHLFCRLVLTQHIKTNKQP